MKTLRVTRGAVLSSKKGRHLSEVINGHPAKQSGTKRTGQEKNIWIAKTMKPPGKTQEHLH